MGSRKYITFDWAIKSILRNKANFAVLEGFLSVLLGESIKIDSILESETNKNREMEKLSRVDMLARDTKGDLILFEVQYVRELDYFHRMLYETSRIITESMEKNAPYSEVKRVYSIHIVYFNLGVGDDYIYKGTTRFIGVSTNHELELTSRQKARFNATSVSDIFPTYYIIKLCNFNDEKSDIGEWMQFLKNGVIDDKTTVRGLVEAKKSLNMITLPDNELKRYKWYMENLRYQASIFETAIDEGLEKGFDQGREQGRAEGMKQGRAEGIEQGRAEGMEEGAMKEKRDNAQKMKAIGIPTEQIAVVTGLAAEEIEKL